VIARRGFAARCAAGLSPAVDSHIQFGLRPRFGLCPGFQGQRPNRGHSPNLSSRVDGKAEPCLTSGGEAAAGSKTAKPQRAMTTDFCAKPPDNWKSCADRAVMVAQSQGQYLPQHPPVNPRNPTTGKVCLIPFYEQQRQVCCTIKPRLVDWRR